MANSDRSPVRVVIDCGGKRIVHICESSRDWQAICEVLRAQLAAATRENRCSSAVVAVHFQDERCDHA